MSRNVWTGLVMVAAIAVLLVASTGSPVAGPVAGLDTPGATETPVCLDCHRQSNVNTNAGVQSSRAFCTDCHDRSDCRRVIDGKAVPLQVSTQTFNDTAHQYVACIQCHADVSRSPHRTAAGAECRGCHTVHGEGTAHAPHLRVDCQACHFKHPFMKLDEADNRVKLAHVDDALQPIGLVDHGLIDAGKNDSCQRCHHPKNTVGAPATVLPAKSLLCVVCHPASLGIGHPVFWIALIVFLGGSLLMVRFWFVGRIQGEDESLHRKISLSSDAVWRTIFSKKILTILRVILLDIILQRRILKNSVQRWSLHSLIFLAILLRFVLSLFTGLVFSLDPGGRLALVLIDKNTPFTAFTYDLLGLCILLGVLWAFVQRLIVKPAHVKTEIEDNITLGILGALVVSGFVAEAARILLTQLPAEIAGFAFIGYLLSKVLAVWPTDWRSTYPYLWYTHAALGALLIAYLPFGKLKHIFNVPLTHVLEEISGDKKAQRI